MNENILEVLKQLRVLKNSGELDDDPHVVKNNTIFWKNVLEYNVLVNCLKHHNEEVRLVALALIVESKKSTECFDKIDFDAIMIFLKYNIGERMEYVPTIKKALKRMKESLAVLRRNIAKDAKMRECESRVDAKRELYEQLLKESADCARWSRLLVEDYRQFYRSFRRLCVDSLRPGSTNSSKKSSLLMLLLGQELLDNEFEESPWCVEDANKLFDCLLLDTYECNKEVIYKIAKSLDASLFRLDDADRVREIIDVALDLANCIRPIDSITASYMLKLALLSPCVNTALDNYPNTQKVTTETAERETLRLIAIVLERLKGPLELAEENIVAATGKHSLYGHLFCVRNLLGVCDLGKVIKQDHEAWRRTVAEIIEISFRLNNSVLQIVNNSSPEGHFPMDTERNDASSMIHDNDTIIVTPQMVLVCSWRTVKEVSLLFGYLSSKSPIIDDRTNVGLVSDEQLLNIGEHLVALLFETKHRGAFEQAHVGFGQLCNRLWRSSHDNLTRLPKIWLHHLLLAVSGLSPGNAKLCATRRSAGVPFMVQALVSSDPFVQSSPASAVFHSVMKILLGFTVLEDRPERIERTKSLMYDQTMFDDIPEAEMKNDEMTSDPRKNHEIITEIKTHALNILRALFKHAQLGDLSRNYAADGLVAAIRSYDGKTWAERNAATLLFSSLITRIFGVQRTKDHVNLTLHNKMTGRIFFERYPSLLPFILDELRAFVESKETPIKPSVQSILLLLSRLYPSFNSDEADVKWKIDEFINLVSSCAKSTVYKTRELAARALVPLLTEKTVKTFTVELFHKLSRDTSIGSALNAHHGYMLQINEIMKSPLLRIEELPRERVKSFLTGTRWIIANLESDNDKSACFPLASVYLDALSELVDKGISNDELDEIFHHRILPHLRYRWTLKKRPAREIYEVAAAKFFIATMKRSNADEKNLQDTKMAWYSILSHENVRVQIASWSDAWRIIEKSRDQKIFDTAMRVGTSGMCEKINDPDLQDAVQNYFNDVFVKLERDDGYFDIDEGGLEALATLISAYYASHLKRNIFTECPSSMRLLGKSYGNLCPRFREFLKTNGATRMIYKIYLDNTWMGSGVTECRIAIASVMYDLFVEPIMLNIDICSSLNWWTSLLNLLVDDNSEVRGHASDVISKIDRSTRLECIFSTLEKFFDLFFVFTRENPCAAFVALLAWSTSLSGDADYEMEENDVFNKCYNYEIFEPLRITDLCVKKLQLLSTIHTMEDELSNELKEWARERFGNSVDLAKFQNCRQLLDEYGKTISKIDENLKNIIDPMYNDKLLRVMTYEKITAIVK